MPDKPKQVVVRRRPGVKRRRGSKVLPFEVVFVRKHKDAVPNEDILAHCANQEIAEALAAVLNGLQVAVWVEGGVVQSGRSNYERVELEVFDQDNISCGEESEGIDTNDQDAMAAAVAKAEEKAEERYNEYPYPIY